MAASLLHPNPTCITTTLKHHHRTSTICFFYPSSLKPTNIPPYNNVPFLTNNNNNYNTTKCNAFFDNNNVLNGLLDVGGENFPDFLRSFEDLSYMQRWESLVFGSLIWIYLTARPGVLIGAIDAYLLAPLQLAFDNLSGRRNLKTADFLVGNRIGEGSFGVVYSGVLLPKSVMLDAEVTNKVTTTRLDPKSKDKVILKKVVVINYYIINPSFLTCCVNSN
jgi:hypothetical protein